MRLKWTPRLVLALLWTIAIVLASSNLFSSAHSGGLLENLLQALHLPLDKAGREILNHLLRKIGHLSAYGLLALLWDRALELEWPQRGYLVALIVCLTVASWDEWHQSLLSRRTGTPYDVAIDMLGASLMILIRFGIRQLQKARLPAQYTDRD